MNSETTATGIAPEMTIPDAVKIARQEAAKKFSRVSKGVRKIAKLKAEKNPGGGGLWRLRK